jgi:molecular chaperone GrpE (heat shock protein)
MSPYEPSPLDEILSGKSTNLSCSPKASTDISQTLTPESILGELSGTDPVIENQAKAPPDFEEPTDESPVVSEPEKPSEKNSPELDTASANSEKQTLEEPAQETTEDATSLATILSSVGQIEQKITIIADASVRTVSEVRDMHKLYHNEFASRLKSMQDELERYREIDRGRIYDGILGEVAKLYSDSESVLDDISDVKVAKKIRYLLMDIVQLLEANGVQRQKSEIGSKRNARYCQVIERISTDDPEQHDTVAQSRNTGFYKENRPLIKELVDIYLYSEKSDEQSGKN